MRKMLIIFSGLFVLLLVSAVFVFGQTAEEHILKGDEYYAQFDNKKALEEYLQAVTIDPSNYQALWKTSRAYFDVADLISPQEKSAEEEQIKMYKESEKYARLAIQTNPNDTWGHFYRSAAMGKRALLLGKKEQIMMSKVIKEEIEKAIELDNTNDLAYHALGRWHRRMAEIGGMKRLFGGILYGSIPKGTFEESEKYFEKALELHPETINHHLELGRTFLAMKKYDLAEQEFRKCLELPLATSKDHLYQEEAKAELEKAKRKGK